MRTCTLQSDLKDFAAIYVTKLMFTDYLQTFYYLIYIYTSGFVSLQLVHVSTHKKYRFYQSLTQIKKRSNCFGNPKQKKSETSTTL